MSLQSRLRVRSRLRQWVFACNRPFSQFFASQGFDLMMEDWDVSIILDACRYDMMVETAPPSWTVESRISPGSESWEFMENTFLNRELHDTVYVTANPHAEKISSGVFHSIENVLETHWDDALRTVTPDEMASKTIEIANKYPNKQIISHWMQPHFPFIGETGQNFTHRGIKDNEDELPPHVWASLMERRQKNKDEVISAYYENLEIAIPHVEKVAESVIGKTIVTADHGNLLGEIMLPIPVPMFGHPRGLRKSELIHVPWVEFESSRRRDTISEPPVRLDRLDEEVVEDRLANLGYR